MNEDPTEKLIRDLKEENERLKAQLSGGNVDVTDLSALAGREAAELSKEEKEQLKKEYLESLAANMADNERHASDLQMTADQKKQQQGGADKAMAKLNEE